MQVTHLERRVHTFQVGHNLLALFSTVDCHINAVGTLALMGVLLIWYSMEWPGRVASLSAGGDAVVCTAAAATSVAMETSGQVSH